jgi:23S rRNA-/tRNA-specific pseudouridylate synthase
MLKQATTLLKKDHLWIFNKQAKQHYNELLKGHSEENKWKSVHRLDYETSGAICYARQDIADQFTKLFKERGAKKFYIAGASKKISGKYYYTRNLYFD